MRSPRTHTRTAARTRQRLASSQSSHRTPRRRRVDSISRFFRSIEIRQIFSHFWRWNKKGFVPGFVPEGRHKNPGWCGVLRVKRARSEEGVPFAPPHGHLLPAQHPPAGWLTGREGRCGKVPARPCRKGRSRRVWRAMDQDAESSDRGPPAPASSVTLCRRRWRSTAC